MLCLVTYMVKRRHLIFFLIVVILYEVQVATSLVHFMLDKNCNFGGTRDGHLVYVCGDLCN